MHAKERTIQNEQIHSLAVHESRHIAAAFLLGETIQGAYLQKEGERLARVDFDGTIPAENLLPIVAANLNEDLIGRDRFAGNQTTQQSDVWLAFKLAREAGAKTDEEATVMVKDAVMQIHKKLELFGDDTLNRFADIFASDAGGTIESHEDVDRYIKQAIDEVQHNVVSRLRFVEQRPKLTRISTGKTTSLTRTDDGSIFVLYKEKAQDVTTKIIGKCNTCSGENGHAFGCRFGNSVEEKHAA